MTRLIIAIAAGLLVGVGATALATNVLSNAANGTATTQSIYSGYGNR